MAKLPFEIGRDVAGIVEFTSSECAGTVRGFLNGPFTESMRRNVEDFIQSEPNGVFQYVFNRGLNTDYGLKTTEVEKRQWTLNVVFINILGTGDPVENFRRVEAMVTYPKIGMSLQDMGKPISVKIGKNPEKWFKNDEVWIIEARGEWSPSVSKDLGPLYISAEITFMEDVVKPCNVVIQGG